MSTKRRDLVKLLKENGFEYERTSGGHETYSNGERSIQLPMRVKDCVERCIRQQIKGKGPFFRAQEKHRRKE